MFLLFLLVLISPISCDQVFNQIFNVMVNKSVEPCDDFYRHVCGIESPGNLFTLAETLFKEEVHNYTVLDDTSEYLVEIINCTKNQYVRGTVKAKLQNEIKNSCLNKNDEIFVTNFENTFNMKLSIDCNSVDPVLEADLDNVENFFTNSYQKGCSSMVQNRHKILWYHRQIESRKSIKNIVEITRLFYKTQIDRTPWIKNNNVTNTYQKLLAAVVFQNDLNSDLNTIFATYSDCKEANRDWLNDSELIKVICVLNSFKNTNIENAVSDELVKMSTKAWLKLENADGTRRLSLGDIFYPIAAHIKSKILFSGIFGSLLGHELAHSIVQGDEDKKIHDIYFSNNASDCVRKQIKKTCSMYTETKCFTNKTTIEEDGADIMASSTALSILKSNIGDAFYDVSKEYGQIKNNQLFFYGNVALFCRKTDSGFHIYSPPAVRMNSMIAQNPEFQKAFQCSPHSKMMQSFEKKCDIFGENAPLN